MEIGVPATYNEGWSTPLGLVFLIAVRLIYSATKGTYGQSLKAADKRSCPLNGLNALFIHTEATKPFIMVLKAGAASIS
eukprot:11149068-Heterocapsa_arctica.AAC.1